MTPIDPDRWRRADEIFQAAIDLSGDERDACVARACSGDDALRATVLALLSADASDGGILDAPAADLAAPGPTDQTPQAGPGAEAAADGDTTPSPDPWIGRLLGRYRIVGRLGEGGMGIVYEAEQEEPRRRIALKVMRGGWFAGEEGLRYFRREAQTLARLQHHGIAAIYEAGRTADGEHFFAMELVRGVPLDKAFGSVGEPDGPGWSSRAEAAARRGVSHMAELRARLDLFLEICDAIVYAHQRGVIHRDLKPSNILVTAAAVGSGDPSSTGSSTGSRASRVKVVDFGLARITDADVSMVASQTEPRALRGTLPYMSPEQTLGRPEDIDFRSDVYSLGVILYRLLVGEPPYVVRPDALLEAVRTIREEPPRRAGAVVPLLRGEVETILSRALEKEPDRRYQSVAAFADDVRRFLSHQPILARPPGAMYQLRKLATRHRAATALLVTLFVVLAASTVTMSFLYQGQRREQARALAEAEKATSVSDFLVNMLTSVDPELAAGKDVTVLELLDVAARDVEAELARRPDVAAALQTAIGRAYVALGLYDKAEPQILSGLEARRRRFGESSSDFAASLDEFGNLSLKQGRMAEAESLLGSALAIRRQSLGERDRDVAVSLGHLANAAHERGEFTRADSLHRIALSIQREVFGPESPEVFMSLNNSALSVAAAGHPAEAESLYRVALGVAARYYGEDHPQYAQALNNLGIVLTDQTRLKEAETILLTALEIRRRAFGDDHPEVAVTRNNVARVYRLQERYAEAVPMYEQAVAAFEKRLGPAHGYTITTISNFAVVLNLMGRTDLAIKTFESSIEALRNTMGGDHPTTAVMLNNLGTCLYRDKQLDRAAERYLEALAMRKRLSSETHPETARVLHNLAIVRNDQRRFAEAESLETMALSIRRTGLGTDHFDSAESEGQLAMIRLARGEAASAESLFRHALVIQAARLPANNRRLALTKSAFGACLVELHQFAEAESLLISSHEILGLSPAATEPSRSVSFKRIVSLYEAWGRPRDAGAFRKAQARPGPTALK